MEGQPVIGKHAVWSIVLPAVPHNYHAYPCAGEPLLELVELLQGPMVRLLQLVLDVLFLVEVVDCGHFVRPESERSDHEDCIRYYPLGLALPLRISLHEIFVYNY